LWICEFCGERNQLEFVEPEDIPKTNERDYILEPPLEEDSKQINAGMVIFVIDISGSMCVTTEVPGTFKLKGNPNPPGFDLPNIPGQAPARRGRQKKVTYVSRLQCVQASISEQLENWAKESPEKMVGLVTFNNSVTIIGDGAKDPVVITGDKLIDEEVLKTIGRAHELKNCIRDSQKSLSSKLWSLEETGPTALGPALLTAVSMAQNSKGSKVIVCTDGLANIGLGAFDRINDEDERAEVGKWYEMVGNLAKLNGVTIDVISIKGSECALEDLGQATEITGGEVIRVDPLELTKNFSTILASPIIAAKVSCTFFLHKGLNFRNEDIAEGQHKVTRDLGNVTADSEIFFEYDIRASHVSKYRKLKSLPFQVQITFTKLDGMKCLRVLSKAQPITTNRRMAEKNVQMDLLASNVAHQSAVMAEKGDYGLARKNNLRFGKMMKRAAKSTQQRSAYDGWAKEMGQFDNVMRVQSERMKAIEFSDESKNDVVFESCTASSSPISRSKKKKKKKTKEREGP